MKTLQECKEEAAKECGYHHFPKELGPAEVLFENVATLYAQQFKDELSAAQSEIVNLRQQLHDHNGMCQKKLSEQLEAFLPDLKACQKHNADLLSTITRNEETIAYYKELAEKADEVIMRPYIDYGIPTSLTIYEIEKIGQNNVKIWEEYQELKAQQSKILPSDL